MKWIAKNLEETQNIAKDFISKIDLTGQEKKALVVGLYGELGAGKTSFTQGVAKALGVTENVVSPTFIIMKYYTLPPSSHFETLIHIDSYRFEHSDELLQLGWDKIISNPKNIVLIEWPERVSDIMPEHIHINFTHTPLESREIEILNN